MDRLTEANRAGRESVETDGNSPPLRLPSVRTAAWEEPMDREREAPGARCGCRTGCWRCPRWLVVSLSLVKGWLGVAGACREGGGSLHHPRVRGMGCSWLEVRVGVLLCERWCCWCGS
jgi:hypothetical protein